MILHSTISGSELKELILSRKIQLGGNMKLKIYGTLTCGSGKRMKKQSRVFFRDEKEAQVNGYRPCGHCLKEEYLKWLKREAQGSECRKKNN